MCLPQIVDLVVQCANGDKYTITAVMAELVDNGELLPDLDEDVAAMVRLHSNVLKLSANLA